MTNQSQPPLEKRLEASEHLSCPITKREWFMDLEHPELGIVPTYGGPFDSYTVPEVDEDGHLRCERYDHDAGAWVEGGEPLNVYLTTEQPCNHDLPRWIDRHREPEIACPHEAADLLPQPASERERILREALNAIIVRCTDGARDYDWRPVIRDIAQRAIDQVPDNAIHNVAATGAGEEAQPDDQARLAAYQQEYERLFNWRDLWNRLSNSKRFKLASQNDGIEEKAARANRLIGKLIADYDAATPPAPSAAAEAQLAELDNRINTNVARMEESQKVSQSELNSIEFSAPTTGPAEAPQGVDYTTHMQQQLSRLDALLDPVDEDE
jgi:hypothetical protein